MAYAFIIGTLISVAGTLVNTYSYVLAFLVFVLFLPVVRALEDVEEFFKQDIGFIVGVALVSGVFFHDYLLTLAAVIGAILAWYSK